MAGEPEATTTATPTGQPEPTTADVGNSIAQPVSPSPSNAEVPGGDSDLPTNRPAASIVGTPNVLKPAKRGGLAGIMDAMADDIAGTEGAARIYKDADGNEYIQHPTLSRKGQWIKIASEALRGAAAGEAAKKPTQALAAGIESGDKLAERTSAQDTNMRKQSTADNLERFNLIKMKHDQAAQEFELNRQKIQADQNDIKFAQAESDRMATLVNEGKAIDLGTYKDEADLANVKKTNPNFWKDVFQNNVTTVPEIGANGKRQGIHLYQTTPGIGNELVDKGTSYKVFVPPTTPDGKPTMEDHVPTGPMTVNQKHAYDLAAYDQMQKWRLNQATIQKEEGNPLQKELTQSEINKNNAEAHKLKVEADEAGGTGPLSAEASALVDDTVQGRVVPERLGYLLGKKEGQKFLAAVSARDPQLDTSKLQAYPKLFDDYVKGKTAQGLRNLNTAFQHTEDLRHLNTMFSRVPGSDAQHEFNNKLVNASAEIANALAKPGATATKEEIAQVKGSLNTFLNRDSAIRTQINSMIEQYKSIRNTWNEGAPSAIYQAKMPDLSPEARKIVRKYAPQEANDWWGKPVLDANKKVIGYTKDGGNTMTPEGGVH